MNNPVFEAITQQGLLPLYFYYDAAVSINILRTLYDAGIRVVEYTNRGEAALDNFKQMLQKRNTEMPDMYMGIGTIKSSKDAEQYLDAGADFLVSPCYSDEIQNVCSSRNAIWIPGCMTPTEINNAEQKGIRFIKLFPGDMLQPAFMKSIKDLFPNVYFMPTGGVALEEENIREWFAAGVSAVGMGSKLISKTSMEKQDYKTIAALTIKAINIIQSII